MRSQFQSARGKPEMHSNPPSTNSTEFDQAPGLWWRYHSSLGWVVKDDGNPDKMQSLKRRFCLLVCNNWSEIYVTSEEWNPPRITWYKNYLQHKNATQRCEAFAELALLQDCYLQTIKPERALARVRKQAEAAARMAAESARVWQQAEAAARAAAEQEARRIADRKSDIRQICERRCIRVLLHFTRRENLDSILSKGLIPRQELESWRAPPKFNDSLRLDERRDSVCLSIGFPNYKMFWPCRCKDRSVVWVILLLKPNVLWELECAFCRSNAASTAMRSMSLEVLQRADSLASMFENYPSTAGTVARASNLLSDYPTDPQAEVLVFGRIAPEYIEAVHFSSDHDRARWIPTTSLRSPCPFQANGEYFRSRVDYEAWQKSMPVNEAEAWPDDPFSIRL